MTEEWGAGRDDLDAHRARVFATQRERSVDALIEMALVKLSAEVDYTYGELLLAAGRLSDKMLSRRDHRPQLFALACLFMICVTVAVVAVVLS